MKYSEAKKAIEALSSKYSVTTYEGVDYFNVNYKSLEVAYVSTEKPYYVNVIWHENRFKQLPFSNKLYMILAELAMTPLDERAEGKKHYVKVYDDVLGYLKINNFTGKMSIADKSEGNGYKTKFTDKNIEELKQRDNIPLDWSKVTLEDAEEILNKERGKNYEF
ncbi:hypothetical protein KGP45_00650 [Pediococcus ethanolidurans]|uniref:hypothetical protein n=1 Tax=Pediococcus ethanolidurans TaxID=319653 RepID=UPI001C1F1A69|nr:hypothetical protein [Pediococcus ethanolidurans]MBU7562653.1 hypothetical protein [Pediococcus ethanolidurans]